MVDAVVREVCYSVCRPQKAQHGLYWAAGERNLVFYADDGRVVGQDHEWVQDALMVTVAMFRMMGLETNLDKTNSMVCTSRFVWGEWGEQAYMQQATGKRVTFRERKNIQVICTK